MTLKARLIGLLDYVEELARLPERAVFSVRSYRTLLFYEQQLRGRVGIHHDVADEDGAIWLRIDRLQRQKPPLPFEVIRPWISVSNDPTKAPEVRDAIIKTMTRNAAEYLVEQGLVDVHDVMKSPKGDSALVDVRLLLDRLPYVGWSIREYLASSWSQWSAAEIPRRETIAIYDKFFSVLQTVETAGVDNPLEMVFGVGFALWKTKERTVEHPIVEAFVEASIDPRTHAIQVRARETEIQVYLKPFLELDNVAVPALRTRALSHIERMSATSTDATPAAEFSPFVPGTFEPILRDAVTLLSPEARYWPDVADDPYNRALPEIADVLTITDNWAIYVRPRSGNLFAQDLGRLKKSIEDSKEDELPPVGRRLVTRPSDFDNVTIGPDLTGGLGTTWNQAPADTGGQETDHTDVLFPKPFNDAQVEIIRRLQREEGAVVQGPPGTGKTHTIANIICHYLATGRSVLVVSKGEPALEVLRDQIPKEVRNFAISLLTSERQGLKQLEHAVEFMDQAANKVPARLDRERVEREKEILSLRQEAEKVDAAVMAWAQKQLENVPEDLCVGDQRWPAELAQLLASERQRDQWLEDDLGPGEEYQPKFTRQHLDDLRAARCRLGEDLLYLGTTTPNRNDLPDAHTISEIHADLLEAATLANTAEQKEVPLTVLRTEEAAERAERLQCDLLHLRSFLHEIDGQDWVRKLYENWITHGVDSERTQLISEVSADVNRLAETRIKFIQRPVGLPELPVEAASLLSAVQRSKRGERPFPLLSFGTHETKQYLEQIEVCGRSPSGSADWNHVANFIDYKDELLSVVTRWNAIAQDIGLPTAPREQTAADRWLVVTNKLLAGAIRIASRFRDQTSDDVGVLFQRGVDRSRLPLDRCMIDRILEAVEMGTSRRRLLSARRTIDDTVERLKSCSGSITARLSAFLEETVGDVAQDSRSIGDEWRDLLAEVQRVNHLQGDLSTVSSVVTLIESSGATKWAEILKTCPPDTSGDPHVPAHALETWRFRRLEAYLKSIDGRSHLAKLSERRADLTHRLDRAMSEVVRLRTYLGLHKRMQGGRRAALTLFLKAIGKIGTGTGVSARRYRGDARAAMLDCMEAVPCWIMPTWRVSESLPATLGAFDLVIIDEASQSDVMALPALLRAKKVLVVGDDRQVSPSPIGLEERKLLQLRHSYLQDQPFAALLMPGTSLYDLAQAVFPSGRILLNEHFRCVEPIIRFSLQFYSEEFVPLRIPKPSERLDPPLVDVFVRNGCRDGKKKANKAEAIAIVNEIEVLVNDPAYRERSIGVVSLIGNQQANVIQNLLLERIGEDAFLRHRIACGDAATFQGKERDIMFLSMIASPGNAQAQVSRLFEQRFNVALSRAKDRMYLFRSVQTEDLRNTQDLKLRVINHFRNPMPAGREQLDDLSALCQSNFEKEVFRRLVNMSYRVTPQVAVGEYYIDLVVDGDNDRRLAIELDGDRFHGPDRWFEDYTRQKTLERVGWRFWRCWASSFFLDPEGCLAELVALLREMKIETIGQGEARHRFTEHRTVDTDELPPLAFDDQENGAEAMAEKGDKVVVAFATEPNRHYLLTLSDDKEDLANGIVSVRSATGTALLGTSAEDEIELVWKGKTCTAVVLQITKTNEAANVDLPPREPDPQDVFGQLDRDHSPVEVVSETEPTGEWSDVPTANTNSRDRQMETAGPEVAATPPQPTPTATQLESWEMTLFEWKQKCASLRERGDDDGLRAIGGHGKDFAHRYRVQQALKEGKAVPKRVRADYPELLSPNDPKQHELFDDD